ncbi:MAG: N-6 DNA methylase [Acetobacteraceae bacterium]
MGPLLTPEFASHALPALLSRLGLYPTEPTEAWRMIQQGLQDFAATGGPVRVLHHVVNPLAAALGYSEIRREDTVATREGQEDGGYSLRTRSGSALRVWPLGSDIDLDTPLRRGTATRVSPLRRAVRVLRACGECVGVVTNGEVVKLLLCDPAGADSQLVVSLIGRVGWVSRTDVPQSYRLLFALASPDGVTAAGEIFDAARMHQTAVTKALRSQARAAIEDFLQCVIDEKSNTAVLPAPEILWRQTLTIVYRLLFVLKLESAAEPGGGFSFAASEAWRRGFSPNRALGPLARRHLDLGHDTGRLLEDGMRLLFRVCHDGMQHSTLSIAPLGGGLFDAGATAAIDRLHWGEHAVALLFDRLLWTVPRGRERERVHYGTLDVEELGRIYESLLDLQPDIATSPMIRVRHGRFDAVVEAGSVPDHDTDAIEHIPIGRFFLRTGLGRRAGGSYYTPHEFVRFLVRETLTPLVKSALENADPAAILRIKVFDPAMGSGHFLVETCRFLADTLYDACCRCEVLATAEARRRIDCLPDPDQRLASYLPARSLDKSDNGVSRTRALAICRRLVTVHCLYGIDQDELAVELAKLSLWLESFAEGLPLTFLDHRLIVGDSIAGPFFRDLSRMPIGGNELDPLLAHGVGGQLRNLIGEVMAEVRQLESSIGTSIADVMAKQAAKSRLDALLLPLRGLARAWSGAVRTSAREANDAWIALARTVADSGAWPDDLDRHQSALLPSDAMALPLDLTFPEVFRPDDGAGGFHAVFGNPPWDVVHYQTKEFLAGYDPRVMAAPTKRERAAIEQKLLADPAINRGFLCYKAAFVERKRLCDRLFSGPASSGSIDLFQIFTERMLDCLARGGAIGIVVPSSLHANEGTMQLRRRFLDDTAMECCFTFENRKKLFDIHGRQKFSLIIARKPGATTAFRCAFYLHSIAQLDDPDRIMVYDREFLAATGGACETFLELRGQTDLRVAKHMFVGSPDMQEWLSAHRITFGREAHMTDDSYRFTPIGHLAQAKALPLHEGKTFHQFTDGWKTAPRYAIHLDAMRDKPVWLRASGHYRLAFREISRGTDERTMIAAMIPPGHIFGHKATCEKAPWERPDATALVLCAVFNSFAFDWCLRRKIAASVSLFMLNGCPAPSLSNAAFRFLAHGALRLSCRHAGFARLWREQLSSTRAFAPELAAAEDRNRLRAAIDAVVARGYGLGRDDYHHILSGFSHKADPTAPEQCLAAFDLLTACGEQKFLRKHDPFSDLPLVDEPGQPDSESPTASATLIPSMPADRMPPA